MKSFVSIIAVTVLVMLAVASGSAVAAQLEFVEPESLSVSYSEERSDEASVWLKNASSAEVVPHFTAVLEDDQGASAVAVVRVVGKAKAGREVPPLPANSIGRYRIYLLRSSESAGQLVASAAGVEPASMPLDVSPKRAATRGIDRALLIPLGAAFLLIACAWAYANKGVSLGDSLGSLELDFTKSFASTLTAVGAFLGTIISANVLPEEVGNLSKEGFTGLNLTFGLAIVLAGFVYSAFQKKVLDKDGKEWKLKGYVFFFLAAAFITLWAVFGEIYTLWLLVEELEGSQGFSALGKTLVHVMLAGAALAMIPYTMTKIDAMVSPIETTAPGKQQALPPPARERVEAPSVSLL